MAEKTEPILLVDKPFVGQPTLGDVIILQARRERKKKKKKKRGQGVEEPSDLLCNWAI